MHKPGIICYIKGITTFTELNGRFVTLVERTFEGGLYYNILTNKTHPLKILNNEKCWRVKSNIYFEWGAHDRSVIIHSFEIPIAERNLIPLEDKDGEDEMITLVGKPNIKEKENEGSPISCN